ncbi:MAG: biopolymer transporter ExbD, partial [Planctomycetes bacterium]|nr:biopolymer transporter ExbD [Planctomycetota bacterium]
VPMVDVVFCLCVFFMCSMKFHSMEGRFDAWLPKNKAMAVSLEVPVEEIRVALAWDAAAQRTVRKFGSVPIRDDDHLRGLLRATRADWVRVGRPFDAAVVDGDEAVPWCEIVNVVNLAKKEQIQRIEFAAGRNYEAR